MEEDPSAVVVDVKDKKKWLENAFKKKEEGAATASSPNRRDLVEDRHKWIQDKLLTQPTTATPPRPTKLEHTVGEKDVGSEATTQDPSVESVSNSTANIAQVPEAPPPPNVEFENTTTDEVPGNNSEVPNVEETHTDCTAEVQVEPELPPIQNDEEVETDTKVNPPEPIEDTNRNESSHTSATAPIDANKKETIDVPIMSKESFNSPHETIDEPPVEVDYPEEAIDPLPVESDDEEDVEDSKQQQRELSTETSDVVAEKGGGIVSNEAATSRGAEPPKMTDALVRESVVVAPVAEKIEDTKEALENIVAEGHSLPGDAVSKDAVAACEGEIASEEKAHTQSSTELPTPIDQAQQSDFSGAASAMASAALNTAGKDSCTTELDIEKPSTKTLQNAGIIEPDVVEETNEAHGDTQKQVESNGGPTIEYDEIATAVGKDGAIESGEIATAVGTNDVTETVISEKSSLPDVEKGEAPVFEPEESSLDQAVGIESSQGTAVEDSQELNGQKDNGASVPDNTDDPGRLVSITTSIDEEDVCEEQIEIAPMSKPNADEDPVFLGDFESPHKQSQNKADEQTAHPDEITEVSSIGANTNEGSLYQDTTEETVMASNSNYQPDKNVRTENRSTIALDDKKPRPVRVKDIITSMSSESSANKFGLTPLAQVPVLSSTNPNTPVNASDQTGVNKHVIDVSQMEFLHTRKGKAFVEQAKKNAQKLREVREDILRDDCCSGALQKEAAYEEPQQSKLSPQLPVLSLLDSEKSDHEVTDSSDIHYSKQAPAQQPMSPSKRSEADSSAEINIQCLESCSVM